MAKKAKKAKKVKKAKEPAIAETGIFFRLADTISSLITSVDQNTDAINRLCVLTAEREGLLSTREIAEKSVEDADDHAA